MSEHHTTCDTIVGKCQFATSPSAECNAETGPKSNAWKPFGNVCGTPGPFAQPSKPGSTVTSRLKLGEIETPDFTEPPANAHTKVRLVRLVAGEVVEVLFEGFFDLLLAEPTPNFTTFDSGLVSFVKAEGSYQWQIKYDCQPTEFTGYEFFLVENGSICWEWDTESKEEEKERCAREFIESHPCLKEKLCKP